MSVGGQRFSEDLEGRDWSSGMEMDELPMGVPEEPHQLPKAPRSCLELKQSSWQRSPHSRTDLKMLLGEVVPTCLILRAPDSNNLGANLIQKIPFHNMAFDTEKPRTGKGCNYITTETGPHGSIQEAATSSAWPSLCIRSRST